MDNINSIINGIKPLNVQVMKDVKTKIDNLAKPIGSLGTLEDIVIKLSGINEKAVKTIEKKSIVIMCADNGIVDEGVSTCPQSTTLTVSLNFVKGTTGVCLLSKYVGSDLTVVDIGINAEVDDSRILNRKISYGTKNIAKEAAMSREDVIKAINVGIDIVKDLKKNGYEMLGTGEMGVGNTSTSAAVISVLTGRHSDSIVGKGSGLTDLGLENKKEVIRRAIEVNKPDKSDTIDVLSKVGGLDIAGLCGCFLGAAYERIPIVMDGVISAAAALCAYRLNPLVRDYIFPSHISMEEGSRTVLAEMGLQSMINLNMRLGEGSGCPFTFKIADMALFTLCNMSSFNESGISKDDYVDIREDDSL
ncbi:nicotinate-nucleotide--dimethylbenzimidazole phosphoribosyltransferase [Clostridium cadaveris]|uniref:nicotinate-nucleotide--dimethylbenzimidazole phosphoribosyltransferase n=1 Tax=Clostridium cadaveris TaxID=1529 RepID=UPI003994A30E